MTTCGILIDREDCRLKIADCRLNLVQAPSLVGGINLKSSISPTQAASLVGADNLQSAISNLQYFDLADQYKVYFVRKTLSAVVMPNIRIRLLEQASDKSVFIVFQ
ncbi:hypothetical protein LC613_43190 [Nostoc sphaeroides CHAB 2801]|uniref:hypothetical protein n=1 Tax=Nostoc sphaeroides TaxID=446679 RepID=UPI0015F2F4ED|nr:hypothetical protein [Nostoc sphaeroides]MCC5634210.1 hypothetical protein [Nostoc sphaeroides CHAB 2801]